MPKTVIRPITKQTEALLLGATEDLARAQNQINAISAAVVSGMGLSGRVIGVQPAKGKTPGTVTIQLEDAPKPPRKK